MNPLDDIPIEIFRHQFGTQYFVLGRQVKGFLLERNQPDAIVVRTVCDNGAWIRGTRRHQSGAMLYTIAARLAEGLVLVEVLVSREDGRPVVWNVILPNPEGTL